MCFSSHDRSAFWVDLYLGHIAVASKIPDHSNRKQISGIARGSDCGRLGHRWDVFVRYHKVLLLLSAPSS